MGRHSLGTRLQKASEGRGKREEGRRKREEGRGKRECAIKSGVSAVKTVTKFLARLL